ncbi:MAG: hypothetical protein AB9834_06705 [Lentimicrobium sp.]
MVKLFNIVFLDDTFEFLSNLEKKHFEKILFNIRKAQTRHDPELFKKLKDEIWDREAAPQVIQNSLSRAALQTACILGQDRF